VAVSRVAPFSRAWSSAFLCNTTFPLKKCDCTHGPPQVSSLTNAVQQPVELKRPIRPQRSLRREHSRASKLAPSFRRSSPAPQVLRVLDRPRRRLRCWNLRACVPLITPVHHKIYGDYSATGACLRVDVVFELKPRVTRKFLAVRRDLPDWHSKRGSSTHLSVLEKVGTRPARWQDHLSIIPPAGCPSPGPGPWQNRARPTSRRLTSSPEGFRFYSTQRRQAFTARVSAGETLPEASPGQAPRV